MELTTEQVGNMGTGRNHRGAQRVSTGSNCTCT